MTDHTMATCHEPLAETERAGWGRVAALGAARALSLAAAPTFAIMALISVFGGGPADMLCAPMHGGLPFDGMVAMYALMSAFHLAPWLRIIG